MKKLAIGACIALCVLALMFTEYRFIMENIRPYRGNGGMVYLEVFGNFDEYYAEAIGE